MSTIEIQNLSPALFALKQKLDLLRKEAMAIETRFIAGEDIFQSEIDVYTKDVDEVVDLFLEQLQEEGFLSNLDEIDRKCIFLDLRAFRSLRERMVNYQKSLCPKSRESVKFCSVFLFVETINFRVKRLLTEFRVFNDNVYFEDRGCAIIRRSIEGSSVQSNRLNLLNEEDGFLVDAVQLFLKG